MAIFNWKRLGLVTGLSLSLFAAGCGSDDDSSSEGSGDAGKEESKDIELTYVEWDSEIASTNVIGKVLEDQGYKVTYTPLDNAVMWQAVANGEADGMVAAWLPATHGDLYEEYKDQVDELGENLEGAKIGLVVPEYMDVDSIEDLDGIADDVDKTIVGIEPGAGVVQASENAVEDYGLDGWEVQTSSSGAMATELGEAYKNEEPIVVTGWTPHWKFAKYDLKYLDDPKETFGEAETINTMVREDLKDDMPNAYKILDQFNWAPEDMEEVMLEIQDGTDPAEAAADWVEDNQDKVDEWTEGVE
ncbi:glycine betaine/proline transport system substrate-binding protein [Virgibacillus halotolerans]|uniref:glycine betaine ABC transporter substrate-binding protein n=1 Tax=Virgibacillus halotolerans TaxID=1071053 RepID=UPI001960E602|nr:glycine betaine ABC transporter substrate-binding protein [Virgibacillus halotolerans]MBM7601691.1 glycine betaine/proline transport system substrate-binding protein [Virgibacillus halotolerans]